MFFGGNPRGSIVNPVSIFHIPTRPYFNLLKDSSGTTRSTIRVITTTTTTTHTKRKEKQPSVTSEETSLNGEVLPYRSQPRCDHLLPRDASVQEAEGMCNFQILSRNEFVHEIPVLVSYHTGTVALRWLVRSIPDRAIRLLSPGHCVVYLSKTNYCHSASLRTRCINGYRRIYCQG